jgi:phage-related protein
VVWPVVYYRAADGSEPVDAFIEALDARVQVVVDNHVERLAIFGPDLPFPHSSHVDGAIRELRSHFGRTHYRILYARSRNLFVLLHAFEKRTRLLPAAEIAVAQGRWDDFGRRMNASRRRPPRAAGHDAP